MNDDTRKLVGALSGSALARCVGDSDSDGGFLLRVQASEADAGGEGLERISAGFCRRVGGLKVFGITGVEFSSAGVCFGLGLGLFDFVSARDSAGLGGDWTGGWIFDSCGAAIVRD